VQDRNVELLVPSPFRLNPTHDLAIAGAAT
jgi:hypothetical protein